MRCTFKLLEIIYKSNHIFKEVALLLNRAIQVFSFTKNVISSCWKTTAPDSFYPFVQVFLKGDYI